MACLAGLIGLSATPTFAGCSARLSQSAQSAPPALPTDAAGGREFEVQRRFTVAEVRQGPAVDDDQIYAIGNRVIAKYGKRSGELLDRDLRRPDVRSHGVAAVRGVRGVRDLGRPSRPLLVGSVRELRGTRRAAQQGAGGISAAVD